MAIGESIKRGHDEYRRIFAKMFKSTPKEAQLRQELLSELTTKVVAHHEGEAHTIFPRLNKMPEWRSMALDLEVEHAAMKAHLREMRDVGYDNEIWPHRLVPLYDIFLAHWDKEEQEFIPFAPEYFSEVELEEYGKKFDQIVEKFVKEHPDGLKL